MGFHSTDARGEPMMRSRTWRHWSLLLATIVMAGLLGAAPATAGAPHCRDLNTTLSQLVTPDGNPKSGVILPAPHPFPGCSLDWAAPQDAVDTRVLWPGTTH